MPDANVTEILTAVSAGSRSDADRLLPLVYDELRALAADQMLREPADHTLQPTAVVHEAYLKLVDQTRVEWQGRAHFFAVAARAIRRILVDHARRRRSAKRGGDRAKISLDERLVSSFENVVDVLGLDELLAKLALTHPRHARIVEVRFFGGLTIKEAAAVLEVSTATVEREWRFARAWLHDAILGEGGRGSEHPDGP